MTASAVEIIEDRRAPGGGWAVICLAGWPEPPRGALTIVVRAADGRGGLGGAGWGETVEALWITGQAYQRGTLYLTVGPGVVDHVPPGADVVLEVPEIGFAERLIWPHLKRSIDAPTEPATAQGPAAPTLHAERARNMAPSRRAPSMAAPRGGVDRSRSPDPVPDPAPRASAPPLRATGGGEAPMPTPRLEAGPRTTPGDSETRPHRRKERGGRDRRSAGARGMALPWRITLVNLALLLAIGATGYAMVMHGWDPIALVTGGGETEVTDSDMPEAPIDPQTQTVLDALAVAESGPVDQAREAVIDEAQPARIQALAEEFQSAGAPDAAMALFDHIARDGHGPALRAIGRMADPLHFDTATSAFSRPNPELAVDWYRRAEAAGDAQAIDDLLALRLWLEARAAEGDIEAQNALLLFE